MKYSRNISDWKGFGWKKNWKGSFSSLYDADVLFRLQTGVYENKLKYYRKPKEKEIDSVKQWCISDNSEKATVIWIIVGFKESVIKTLKKEEYWTREIIRDGTICEA